MTQMTISAQVVDGRLVPPPNLALLEGQHIIGTLTAVSTESANGKSAEQPSKNSVAQTPKDNNPPTAADEDFDPEPPEWLQVEKDLYFPMTRPEENLGKMTIREERGEPCIILPEELPDD